MIDSKCISNDNEEMLEDLTKYGYTFRVNNFPLLLLNKVDHLCGDLFKISHNALLVAHL